MSYDKLSHFTEKSGVISCNTEWGKWSQTVHEIHIDVNLPPGTKAKEVSLKVAPSHVECIVHKNIIFKGKLYKMVKADETVWTIEDNKLLNIVMTKADHVVKEEMWESLLEGAVYQPDPLTLHEMRKKLDLEKFQIENPGFDFSNAELSKCYDKMPGWSTRNLTQNEPEATEHK